MQGINFLKHYRGNSKKYLPMIDHQYKVFPSRDEYGDSNIGWNCGMLKDRPYFLECWAMDGTTMLTVFISDIGIEDYTAKQLDQLLESNGLYKKKEHAPDVNIKRFTDSKGNSFFSINIVVGFEDEDAVIEDSVPIYSFDLLNKLNQ